MSAHLSISYSGPAPASGTPASAAAVDTPAPDSPLGFLTALIDQLLAGGAAPATDTTQVATTDPTPQPVTSGLFNLNSDVGAVPVAPGAPPQTVKLFGDLAKQLATLKQQLDAGETPDPAAVKKLSDTVDAIAALINVPAQPAQPTAITLDPLKTIEAAAATPAKLLPDIPGTKAAEPTAQPADPMTALLASLGVTLPGPPQAAAPPPVQSVATVSPATPTAPALPAIAQLAQKLTEIAQASPVPPELAQKLEALSQKLSAVMADPTASAQLASATSADGTPLEQIVKQILDAKPAPSVPATPQLAAATPLPVPEPIAAKAPAAEAPPTLPPIPKPDGTAAPPDLKVTASIEAPDPQPDDKRKADTKIAAVAAAIADATKADAPDTGAQAGAVASGVANAAPVAQTIAVRAIPAAYQAAANPINMGQVAFEMARQMHQGQSRFTIRIDPPELGRVDVKMHVDAAGTVNARLTVERSETLDMFQRDRGSLEKALTQAGLDSGKTNLEFSLKQNPFAGTAGGDQRQQSGYANASRFGAADGDDAAALPAITLYRGTASAGGVNIFA